MTILYAEDDSMTVMEVQEKLENNGYEVIVAYDGNEALEKFIACKPDLIVLDVDMPGKDGLEVLQFIRLQDSQTPVIIYSCLIDEEKQIKGLEWGANVYLLKNYSPTLLLAQIQRCIARSGEEVIRLSKQVEYDFSACNLRVSDGAGIWSPFISTSPFSLEAPRRYDSGYCRTTAPMMIWPFSSVIRKVNESCWAVPD